MSMANKALQEISPDEAIEKIYGMIADAYSFLFREGEREGNWTEARSTALAGMCLDSVCDPTSPWCQLVKDWLIKSQCETGSWGEEIWDTAMCLLALKKLGESTKRDSLQKGLHWIASKYSLNGRDNWHDEPWETAWALIAVLRLGLPPEGINIPNAVEWFVGQDEQGRVIAPHYTGYFLLIHDALPKIGLQHNSEKLATAQSKAVKFLIRTLQDSDEGRLWTGEAWSNGQILWALAGSNCFPVTDAVLLHKAVNWFELHQLPEAGNWSDVEDTSSAILGLSCLLQRLVALTEGHNAYRVINEQLHRRVAVPKPYVSRPLLERQLDGSLCINLSHRTVELVYEIGGALAALGVLATLIDFTLNHWGWWHLVRRLWQR